MADIKKVIIWVHKDDVIKGEITEYFYTRPYSDIEDHRWVSIEVTRDEFVRLEDERR